MKYETFILHLLTQNNSQMKALKSYIIMQLLGCIGLMLVYHFYIYKPSSTAYQVKLASEIDSLYYENKKLKERYNSLKLDAIRTSSYLYDLDFYHNVPDSLYTAFIKYND